VAFEGNYGSVLRDCSQAISLNCRSSKAYYRSGSALISLGRIDEALDCCNRCLAFDTDNRGIEVLRERVLTIKKDTDRKKQDKQERLRKEGEDKMKMQIAFRVRFFGLHFLLVSYSKLFFWVSFTRNAT
jgi:small subunit ribosomal protein S7e